MKPTSALRAQINKARYKMGITTSSYDPFEDEVPLNKRTERTLPADAPRLSSGNRPVKTQGAFDSLTPMSERTEPTLPDDAPKLYTHDGYPARQNPDGSHSTEVSITVTNPAINNGVPTNIPSLWKGKEVDEKTAIKNAVLSGNKYSKFPSIEEAVESAVARSQSGGYTGSSGTRSVATFDPFKNKEDLRQRVMPSRKLQASGAYERMIASKEKGN